MYRKTDQQIERLTGVITTPYPDSGGEGKYTGHTDCTIFIFCLQKGKKLSLLAYAEEFTEKKMHDHDGEYQNNTLFYVKNG